MVSFSHYTLALLLSLKALGVSVVKLGDTLEARDGPGVIRLDFDVVRPDNSGKRDYDEVELTNQKVFYSANLYIGSNNADVKVEVDTGSSELWVVSPQTSCSNTNCRSQGVFDPSKSTSFKNLNEDFLVSYFDKTLTTGYYGTDSVSFSSDGSNGIKNFQFAVAQKASGPRPMLGIGFTSLEGTKNQYPNLPAALKNLGVISKNAYSLYLNGPSSSTGSIIFGGIDTAKYSGSLTKLQLTGDPKRLNVNLNSVSYNGKSSNVGSPVTLDSGATQTYLYADQLKQIYLLIGAKPFTDSNGNQKATVSCNISGSLSFNFDGVSVQVPFSDLYTKNGNTCTLAINPAASGTVATLGDNFLRYAYVYYDLDDKYISLAQVKYTSDSNVQTV